MAKGGVKRASPGAEDEKDPLTPTEIGPEEAGKLAKVQNELQSVDLAMDRLSQSKMLPVFTKRREVVKSIPKFWPLALMHHSHFQFFAQHNADLRALSFLEDLWIAHDPVEHRCFTIEFHFKENPFFTNTVLKKEYKYNAPANVAEADNKPDENGITPTMIDFSWQRDVEALPFKIDWKDPENALTKLYPGQTDDDEDEDLTVDAGSFFNFFEKAGDEAELGITIANEVFPEAIEFFLGTAGHDEDMDSDDEEDEDDEDEIDLEKPKSKKQKV
ncbi:hypothetical protein C8R43DRAFT_1052513 [Mycena crocata]|nr:hypothetical protein C8R43DRAFT_1052513 [Mycena crocata]